VSHYQAEAFDAGLLSSALAAPVDTSVFLLGAEAIRPGMFTLPNISMSIIGKMVGALVIWWLIRKTMEQGDQEAIA